MITSKAKNLAEIDVPSLSAIREARQQLGDMILETPVWPTHSKQIKKILGDQAEVFFKFEIWQYGGTFKPRGALIRIMNLSEAQRKKGVVAVSAGNHAIAVSYAAKTFGISAKVIMPKNASSKRIEQCHRYGAEVIFADDMFAVFDRAKEIIEKEGRAMVHPFDGPEVALGTATLGLELCEQISDLDAVIVAIGGGGLIGGMSMAIKQIQPQCKVYGVEPEGAATMTASFIAGQPIKLKEINTIAISLSAPNAEAYSFNMCSRFVDGIVTVSDKAIVAAMNYLFDELKLAIEPATATALAGVFGPLQQTLYNKRVAVILCGANTDVASLAQQLKMY